MTDDDDKREPRLRAEQMRNLTDVERDMLISAASNVVDRRSLFEDRQKQVELSRSYRRPNFRNEGNPA